jgi:hypothetical protein
VRLAEGDIRHHSSIYTSPLISQIVSPRTLKISLHYSSVAISWSVTCTGSDGIIRIVWGNPKGHVSSNIGWGRSHVERDVVDLFPLTIQLNVFVYDVDILLLRH